MTDLQRAARTRKLVYLGLIVALFTLSMLWRGKLALGDATAAQPAALDRLARWTVQGQADDLEMSEVDLGDPEIAGSAARVSLVGFRGVVITVLWASAIEKQKRHEFHEFELYARMVTRLQPNFITPWLFQGWNITYNVSVENERLGDMFFFIARGIELLSEGDRLNTRKIRRPGMEKDFYTGSPDLRRELAFFYQNKFTVSDKVTTLRCLMQMSVIPPEARTRNRFVRTDGTVDEERFRQFVEENPQLVRRLITPKPNPTLGKDVYDTIAGTSPEIADFLAKNLDLPTRWGKDGRLKSDEAQFPTLPPAFAKDGELHAGHPDLNPDNRRLDGFDAVLAARSWFSYALEVAPPPPPDGLAAAAPRRERLYPWDEHAQYKYRLPTQPALIIFRNYPARAQTYLAERLQKEGWYDKDTLWAPDETRGSAPALFPEALDRIADLRSQAEKAAPGTPAASEAQAKLAAEQSKYRFKATRNSLEEWDRAKRNWEDYGRINGMDPTDEQRQAMRSAFERTINILPPNSPLPDVLTPELADRMTAQDLRLRQAYEYYPQNLSITNYARFKVETAAEAELEMVAARKRLLAAETLRSTGDLRATAEYAGALAQWRRALANQPRYHLGERSDNVHEFTFDLEQKLVTLWKDDPTVLAEAKTTLENLQLAIVPLRADEPRSEALKYLLQQSAEERATTEIAVQMRIQQDRVSEAVARAEVAVGGKYHYLRWFTGPEANRPQWVNPEIRVSKLTELGFKARPASSEPPPEATMQPPQIVPANPKQ